MNKITSNEYYKKNFAPIDTEKDTSALAKVGNFIENLHNSKYFAPKGLYPVEWPKDEKKKITSMSLSFKVEKHRDLKEDMAELAKDLNVDAVVIVELDYCYTGATAILGNGTAKLTASSCGLKPSILISKLL